MPVRLCVPVSTVVGKCLTELLEKIEKGISFFIFMNVVIDGKYLGFAVGSQKLP